MATYVPLIFSSSSNGRPIQVNNTSSPGTGIHTVATATNAIEDIFLDLYNTATVERQVVIEFGSTATTHHLYAKVPGQDGPYRAVAGLRLQGATGVGISVFATATGTILVAGGVNRSQ